MIKTAQQQAQYNAFYNMGVRAALGHTKTAGIKLITPHALGQMMSGGVGDSLILVTLKGERVGGQLGTLSGALGGGVFGEGLGMAAESPTLSALLGLTGVVGGGALGNIGGRYLGAGLGGVTGAISGLAPLRAAGNFLADPLRLSPHIRG